jgi:Tol biopolymer transport system component
VLRLSLALVAVVVFCSAPLANAEEKGNGGSSEVSVATDGSRVAFTSGATNFDYVDVDGLDIYLRDVGAGTTTLVSRASGSSAQDANGSSVEPALAGDGESVAFESMATNLSSDDLDPERDIYVRDLSTNQTLLVSRADGVDGIKANGVSFRPSISADGRYVAFASTATNLSTSDSNDSPDIYVRDLLTAQVTLVSRADGSDGAPANGLTSDPMISADGNAIVFLSRATNLDSADAVTDRDVYVRYLESAETVLASRGQGLDGEKAADYSDAPAISADGSVVAFHTYADNLPDADGEFDSDVYVRNLAAGTTVLASRATGPDGANADAFSAYPTISADGSRVGFVSTASNLVNLTPYLATQHVYVRDLTEATTSLVSRAAGVDGAPGNESSAVGPDLMLSGDGDAIAFSSGATNLHPQDSDEIADAYLRDLSTHTMTLLSVGPGGFDVDPPVATITGGPGLTGATRDPTPTFTFVANEPASFECRFQGLESESLPRAPCSSPFTVGPLAEGKPSRFFYVNAIDGRGNEGAPTGVGFRYRPARCGGEKAGLVGGDEGSDTLEGSASAEVIHGLAGDDVIRAGGGADVACGGTGADSIRGGRGADRLFGGDGKDALNGGAGTDVCVGGDGQDTLTGCEIRR